MGAQPHHVTDKNKNPPKKPSKTRLEYRSQASPLSPESNVGAVLTGIFGAILAAECYSEHQMQTNTVPCR